MDPIRNIIKVRVNNQDYLYQYENAWDKEKQRSYSKHRITVGKLVDGKVQLGRKFLTNNPQYKDIEFKFEDHKLIATSDLPTVNDAGRPPQFVKFRQPGTLEISQGSAPTFAFFGSAVWM